MRQRSSQKYADQDGEASSYDPNEAIRFVDLLGDMFGKRQL